MFNLVFVWTKLVKYFKMTTFMLEEIDWSTREIKVRVSVQCYTYDKSV